MPPSEEDIAWLKSTFRPMPRPGLPNDCIEYALYILPESGSEVNSREELSKVQREAARLQKEYLRDYIWQRQPFALGLAKENGEVCRKLS